MTRHALLFLAGIAPAAAATYPLPPIHERLVGEITYDVAAAEDTLPDIARRHRLGFEELALANPTLDHWLPQPGTQVVLPTRFILPWGEREGIVVNLAEYRLYYFPKRRKREPAVVHTYAVSGGRDDWPTPRLHTYISRKLENPAWYPNRSIRKEHEADGDRLPAVVPPGPDNPLGPLVLKLAVPGGYFIHGTSRPFGIGMSVTHGCLRLYPEDIAELFANVPRGTKVRVINESYKATWKSGVLYVEAHPPLDADGVAQVDRKALEQRVRQALARRPGYVLDPGWLDAFLLQPTGIPTPLAAVGAVRAEAAVAE